MVSAPRKLRILGQEEQVRPQQLRPRTSSYLARGVASARLGLVPEANCELEKLQAENPENLRVKQFRQRLMAQSQP